MIHLFSRQKIQSNIHNLLSDELRWKLSRHEKSTRGARKPEQQTQSTENMIFFCSRLMSVWLTRIATNTNKQTQTKRRARNTKAGFDSYRKQFATFIPTFWHIQFVICTAEQRMLVRLSQFDFDVPRDNSYYVRDLIFYRMEILPSRSFHSHSCQKHWNFRSASAMPTDFRAQLQFCHDEYEWNE